MRVKQSTVHNPRQLAKLLDSLIGLEGSVTWNPGSLVDSTGETKSLTVAGAALGDFVTVAPPCDCQDLVVTGYVQAANTVEIRVQNESGSTVDLASGTWKVRVQSGTDMAANA